MTGKTALRRFTPLMILGWVGVFCVAILLSGCVHHPIDCAAGIYHSDCLVGTAGYQTSPDSWYNPSLDPNVADRQRGIDTAECQTYAMQSIPLPPAPQAAATEPALRSYTSHGTVTSYGANGETSTGYYSGTVSENSFGAFNFGAMQQSLNSAQDRATAIRARNQLTDACMLKRGWTNGYATQQANMAALPAGQLQTPSPANPNTSKPISYDPTPVPQSVCSKDDQELARLARENGYKYASACN